MIRLRQGLRGFVLAVCLVPFPALADLPTATDTYVNDFAEVLSDEAEEDLRRRLLNLRDETQIHGVVATLRSPTDYTGPQDLPAFATALFNDWGIGDSLRHDGILILVATDTREIRIALGSGYEPVWDNRAQRVIDALMVPLLRDERYADGLQAGVTGIADYIARPYSQGVSFNATEGMPEAPAEQTHDLAMFLAFAGIVGIFALASNRGEISDALARRRPCPQCGTSSIRTEKRRRPGQSGRSVRRFCTTCRWEAWRDDTAGGEGDRPSDREAGGGGGGGFGGGSSSGGGASGRF
ncbi:TPM domain-containing protein [Falsigemmobacter faecalis]|uniref:TPM domain-containing protein n=1 Tax=Falsigemmobacter faecalis TaxID=2488730 RepID=A0A3P3DKS1_9RHOB|nr:TPM domain-containing protein [Falsigemmobacter faecalis]RRH74761.1 TPM domain-containing protein [Falsigemmobacter faecalis]